MVKKIAGIIFAVVFALFIMQRCFLDEKQKIINQFSRLSSYVSKEPGESTVQMALKANSLIELFSDECELEVPHEFLTGIYSPQEIAANVSRGRMMFKNISLKFYDISVDIKESEKAFAPATVHFRGNMTNGKTVEEIREIKAELLKKDKSWIFKKFEVVETLKK
jgi:hypothetical protein